ncbi:HIT family protein [Sphingomonas sp. DBB INV C78]|uniref:HIT family protein n=1 Tax=Sphingomonas sp. DBB INV C78 TaxID=3349434 RepID=UPI0036D257C0
MNDTILRFGYPATLIADYRHWMVLLRPDQPTLGSLVLASTSEAKAFGSLPAEAYAELGMVSAHIEAALSRAVSYEKINYLMLMMVDPHVHYHVIPRYAGSRSAEGLTIADAGWPKVPALGEAVKLDTDQVKRLAGWIKGHWRR